MKNNEENTEELTKEELEKLEEILKEKEELDEAKEKLEQPEKLLEEENKFMESMAPLTEPTIHTLEQPVTQVGEVHHQHLEDVASTFPLREKPEEEKETGYKTLDSDYVSSPDSSYQEAPSEFSLQQETRTGHRGIGQTKTFHEQALRESEVKYSTEVKTFEESKRTQFEEATRSPFEKPSENPFEKEERTYEIR